MVAIVHICKESFYRFFAVEEAHHTRAGDAIRIHSATVETFQTTCEHRMVTLKVIL